MNQLLEELKNRVKKNPRDAYLLRRLGQIYLKTRCYKRSQEEYKLAANFNPRLISEIILDHEKLIKEEPGQALIRMSLISFFIHCSDIDSAILELEEFLETDPLNATVYNLLGKIYIQLNQIDQALTLLEYSQSLGVKDIGISQMLASVYLEKGRLSEAITFYEELSSYSPNDKNLLRTLGELYTRTLNIDRAAECIGQLFSSDPESAAEVSMKLENLLMKDETNILTRKILADVYMKSLKPEKAAEKLNEILLLDPNIIDFVISQNKLILKNYPNHPMALLNLASVQAQKGNFSEAIESYENLIQHHPDYTEPAISGCKQILDKFPNQYLAHQFLTEVYISQEKFEEAIKEIKILLELHQDAAPFVINICRDAVKKFPFMYEATALAHLKNHNIERATLEAEKLLSYDRNSAAGYILIGKINLEKKLSRKAYQAFENALHLSPYDISIHSLLKEARHRELAIEEESLKKRIIEDEWKIALHFELAKVYVKMDRHQEALKELQLATRDQQRSFYIYNLMSELYIEEGRINLALSAINTALQEPYRDEFQDVIKKLKYNQALCHEAHGNIKKAIKTLEQILSTDLSYPGLAEKIKFLKNSSLKSLQNKMLVVSILDIALNKTCAIWGRESKIGSRRKNITASFGQSHNNSGFDYYCKGMYKAAMEEFDLASKIDPALISATNNLGVIYIEGGRINEAIQKFKDALRADSSSSIILNNLGVSCFLDGDIDQAIKHLKKALNLNPELAAAQLNLGDLFYLKGDAKKALECYKAIKPHDFLYTFAQKRLLYKQT